MQKHIPLLGEFLGFPGQDHWRVMNSLGQLAGSMVCSEQSAAGLRPLGSLSSDYRERPDLLIAVPSGRYSQKRFRDRISLYPVRLTSPLCVPSLALLGVDRPYRPHPSTWLSLRRSTRRRCNRCGGRLPGSYLFRIFRPSLPVGSVSSPLVAPPLGSSFVPRRWLFQGLEGYPFRSVWFVVPGLWMPSGRR